MKLITPKFWKTRNILSYLLYPISIIYRVISSCLSYSLQIYQPKAKIIRIGNITMGGAGKTPVVLSIAKILSSKKIAILTRGYKGELLGPIMVNEYHNVDEVGDEALLLLRQAPTCVAKDRLKGIKFLESLGYDIIITDDGMQDNRFKPFLTIMVVDGHFGFGNGMIFPSGPLRESIKSGIKKTDFIVIIGGDEFDCSIPVLRADFVSNSSLEGQKFIAFAGIGNPDKFFLSVNQAGGEILEGIVFADHYQYTEKDLEHLISKGKPLITTEKDYVRIDKKYRDKIQVLPIDLIWQDKESLNRLLKL